MKTLILDNYDSFTYNLAHMLRDMGESFDVKRNDQLTLDEALPYNRILLSPGPGIPTEAGFMLDLIRMYAPTKSILGVCLGHQGIAEVFGGKLFNMKTPCHGTTTTLEILMPNERLFRNVSNGTTVGLYHSWAVEKSQVPNALEITSMSCDGIVMSLSHKEYDVKGVQFHPESVLTGEGTKIISNWLEERKKKY